MVNRFLHLKELSDLHYFINLPFNFNDSRNLSFLNHYLSNNFWNFYDFFLNYWYFNSSVDYFFYLFYQGNNLVYYSFDLFDPININDLFFYYCNLMNCRNLYLNSNHLLNNLRNFYNFFYSLDNWNSSFDNSINYLMNSLYVIDNFSSISVLYFIDNFLYEPLDFNDLWHLNHLFNYFFHNSGNFDNSLDNSFYWNHFFFNNLYLLNLWDGMIDYFLNFIRNLSLYYFLYNIYNLLNLRYFDHPFDYFLDDSWDLDDLFNYSLNLNNLFYNVIDILDDFHRNMNNLLNFLDLWNFNNFLNDLLDRNYLWNLYNPIHNFLNNFLYFDYLRNHSKHLQNIVYIDNSHNFLIDHTNNSFINLKNSTCS